MLCRYLNERLPRNCVVDFFEDKSITKICNKYLQTKANNDTYLLKIIVDRGTNYYLPKSMKFKIEEAGNTTVQVLVARVAWITQIAQITPIEYEKTQFFTKITATTKPWPECGGLIKRLPITFLRLEFDLKYGKYESLGWLCL